MENNYLHPLTRNIFWSYPDPVCDRPIMAIVIGSERSLIVEAGASPRHAAEFIQAVINLNCPPPRYVAITHWHWDHVFGNHMLGLPAIGHSLTYEKVVEMAKLDWRDKAIDRRLEAGEEIPFIAEYVKVELSNRERASLIITPPDILFEKKISINLGEVTCQVIHVGGDHSPDSSVVFIPEEKVVFLGDCIYGGFEQDDVFYTREKFFPLADQLLALDADYYLPAHQAQPMTRKEFTAEMEISKQIGDISFESGGDCKQAIKKLETYLEKKPNEDQLETLDCFIKGLRKIN